MDTPVTRYGPADPTGEIRGCTVGNGTFVVYEQGASDAFLCAHDPVDVAEWQ